METAITPLGVQGLSDAEVATVKETIETWTAALVKGDLAAWTGFWAKDAVLMPPGHVAFTGNAERDAYAKANFQGLAKATFSDWTVVGRDDLAVVSNIITVERKAEGAPIVAKQIIVLRRQSDGRWLVQDVIFNSND